MREGRSQEAQPVSVTKLRFAFAQRFDGFAGFRGLPPNARIICFETRIGLYAAPLTRGRWRRDPLDSREQQTGSLRSVSFEALSEAQCVLNGEQGTCSRYANNHSHAQA